MKRKTRKLTQRERERRAENMRCVALQAWRERRELMCGAARRNARKHGGRGAAFLNVRRALKCLVFK